VALALCASPRPAHAERKYRVLIKSTPPGAEIYLNDTESEPIGFTPFSTRLEAGVHTIILVLDKYEPEYLEVAVKKRSRRQTFSADLKELELAFLEVVADGASVKAATGATVYVDGNEKGKLPLEVDVAAGPHEIRAEKDGHEPVSQWVEVESGTRQKVVIAFESTSSPEPATKVVDVEKPVVHKKAEKHPRTGPPLVTVAGGVELGGRRFRYDQPQTSNLRPYDAGGVPRFRLLAEVYPLVPFSDNKYLYGIGLTAQLGQAIGLESSDNMGMTIDTSWTDFEIGARYQLPVSMLKVGLVAAYGAEQYTFDQNNGLFDVTPSVDYRFVCLGADIGFSPHPMVSVFAGGNFKLVSSTGDLGDRFAQNDVTALGAGVGVTARVYGDLGLRLEGRYSYYGHTFTPAADNMFVAQGGSDQIFNVMLGAAYSY
jgi:hypothetical protein